MKLTSIEEAIQRRFWTKVFFSEMPPNCWIWLGAKANGYGRFKLHGRCVSTHVLSYKWSHTDYQEGLFVCHHCDNRSCVNPDHLFLGTCSDNMRDAVNKGRIHYQPPRLNGSEAPWAKLNEEQVLSIKIRVSNGESQTELAKEYKVNRSTISLIKRGLRWKHVTIK